MREKKEKRENSKTTEKGKEKQYNVNTSTSNGLGDYVIAMYDGKPFIGLITDSEGDKYEINAMRQRTDKMWLWPKPKDQIWYSRNSIAKKIEKLVLSCKTGAYVCKDMDEYTK
ncbi:unnamed protein product [Psylliodes chrysocephalus]|uniref:Uncharacterized protein n=1 Tax=Psylliodes chrysocephalus TaxID=3402493 RepID=A0A9P0GGF9_9CUCU|nr:unnamed protein product [Psylliodes chrysocephala]